jgi:predicted metal-dependent phosphoesterase TrpH
MIRIDLHTHSTGSPDGGIRLEDYRQILSDKTLDVIAITDHDSIETAVGIQKELGAQIIVGEEISTKDGELIGLYLTNTVPAGLSAQETVAVIKAQGGLVCVPHPFETVRKGITQETLDSIERNVDIIEVHNGRAVFQNKGPQAATWARIQNIVGVASSDAHGSRGLGTTYTTLNEVPTKETLVELLQTARLTTKRPPLLSLLYPKLHRLRAKINK